MPPVVPNPENIKSFRDDAAFEKWLASNHARESELWLKIHKKDSGLPTVTHVEALDVALCWGWIDGLRKSFDDKSFLQRFTPRTAKSIWSQVNQKHVARLKKAGRMTPHGQQQIDAAKRDGRWKAAYAPIRKASHATIPKDLRAAIDANPRARKTFKTLGRMDLFAMIFRTNNMKTPAGRATKIAGFVATLASGKRILALLLVIALGRAVAASETVTHPYQGITYIDRTGTTPRAVHMHVVQVDLTSPGIRCELTPPSGDRETTRQTSRQFLEQEHADVAINGHFFLPFPSSDTSAWVIGLAASDGRVYSAFESPEQNFALVADAPAVNIDRANHASIVHRDSSRADGLHVLEPVTLWTTIAGSAEIVTNGAVTIPVYRDADHAKAALTPGSARNYANGHSWYDAINARSALGLSRDGRTLTLFTVDAAGGSQGMTVGEVAAMLISDYGVWNAINLDGGGSTSLAMRDPATGAATLVNASSDNPAGRSVGSSLLIFAAALPKK